MPAQRAHTPSRAAHMLGHSYRARHSAGADEPKQFCPLWSVSLGQRDAFVRLAGELSARIAHARGPTTPSTRPVQAEFRGQPYQVLVFARTSACAMTAKERGDEMVAMLASGVTEERVTALLERWSQAAHRVTPPAARAAAS